MSEYFNENTENMTDSLEFGNVIDFMYPNNKTGGSKNKNSNNNGNNNLNNNLNNNGNNNLNNNGNNNGNKKGNNNGNNKGNNNGNNNNKYGGYYEIDDNPLIGGAKYKSQSKKSNNRYV